MSLRDSFRVLLAATMLVLMSATASAQVSAYQQTFDGLDALSPTALGPFGEGFSIFADVWGKPGGDATVGGDIFLYSYGPFAAPNGGPGFSAIAGGEGGVNQGTQYLNIYSDYNNPDQTSGGNCGPDGCTINTSVFKEYTNITASSTVWTLSFDYKSPFAGGIFDAANDNGGDINNPTSASAFIKTLDPGAGYATTNDVRVDMTGIDNVDWARVSISLDISDPALTGQILQFGFNTVTTEYDNTGVYYDNICWSSNGDDCGIGGPNPVPVPAAVWLFGSALGLLGVARRRLRA